MKILKNFDITKEVFPAEAIESVADPVLKILLLHELSVYYKESKEKADRLTLEDEYVGITYDNLNTIKNVLVKNINKNKHVLVK